MFTSNVEWPKGTIAGGDGDVTIDRHQTKEQAEAVCNILRRQGLGCNGKIFPVRAWVDGKDDQPKTTEPQRDYGIPNAPCWRS